MTMGQLGTAIVKIETDTSGVDKGFASVKGKAQGLGKTMQTALGTAAGFGAAQLGLAGVGMGFKFLVGNAADFEEALDGVQAAAGATESEMASMRTEALRIGKDTSKSANEAVEAMGELVKAGMDVETVLNGGADAAVALAEATGVTVPEAAILVSNSLNTFKDDAMDSSDAANMFAKTANASAIDVRDLGMSLSAVGPVAAAAGLSMEDFSVAMGLMGNNAMRGSDAGTSLKAMLSGLTPSSDKAADSMKELGFNAFDAQGNFKSMPEIISDLDKSLQGLTEQQRAATLELWFGSDGVRAANILLKEGVDGWDGFTDAMGKAPDVAEQARIRMDNFNGRIEALSGSLETLSITIGSAVLPMLQSLVEIFITALDIAIPVVEAFAGAFSALPTEAQGAITTFAAVAVAIGPVTAGAKAAGGALKGMSAMAALSGPQMLALAGALTAAYLATKYLDGSVVDLSAEYEAAANPAEFLEVLHRRAAEATGLEAQGYEKVIKQVEDKIAADAEAAAIVAEVRAETEQNATAQERLGQILEEGSTTTATWGSIVRSNASDVAEATEATFSWEDAIENLKATLDAAAGSANAAFAELQKFENVPTEETLALDLAVRELDREIRSLEASQRAGNEVSEESMTALTDQRQALLDQKQALQDATQATIDDEIAKGLLNDRVSEGILNHDELQGAIHNATNEIYGEDAALQENLIPTLADLMFRGQEITRTTFVVNTDDQQAQDAIVTMGDLMYRGDELNRQYMRVNVDSSEILTAQSRLATLTAQAGGQGVTLSSLLGYAEGGRPPPGVPAVVGEQGWEIFVPDQAGTILNHQDSVRALRDAQGEGGPSVYMPNATIYARDEQDAQDSMEDVAWALASASARRGVTSW